VQGGEDGVQDLAVALSSDGEHSYLVVGHATNLRVLNLSNPKDAWEKLRGWHVRQIRCFELPGAGDTPGKLYAAVSCRGLAMTVLDLHGRTIVKQLQAGVGRAIDSLAVYRPWEGGAEWRVVGNCVAPPGQNLPFVKVWKVGEGHVDQKATLPDENIEEGAPLLAYKLGGLGGGWRLVSPRDQKRVLRVFDPEVEMGGESDQPGRCFSLSGHKEEVTAMVLVESIEGRVLLASGDAMGKTLIWYMGGAPLGPNAPRPANKLG
jgi:hypothetical protein